jgi:hypothetical protein
VTAVLELKAGSARRLGITGRYKRSRRRRTSEAGAARRAVNRSGLTLAAGQAT